MGRRDRKGEGGSGLAGEGLLGMGQWVGPYQERVVGHMGG